MDTGQLPGQIIDRHPFRRKRTGIPSTSTNFKLILTNIVKQLELFPPQKLTYSRQPSKLEMSADALYQWKQRIFEYQSAEKSQPQQQTLFELAPDTCNADTLDPFSLQLHNLSFCEQPDAGDGFKSRRTPRFKSRRTLRTCLYFAIDTAKPTPLLLYVGETERSPKQRWTNHYIGNYIEMHRRYSLDVAVGINIRAQQYACLKNAAIDRKANRRR